MSVFVLAKHAFQHKDGTGTIIILARYYKFTISIKIPVNLEMDQIGVRGSGGPKVRRSRVQGPRLRLFLIFSQSYDRHSELTFNATELGMEPSEL